MTEEIIIERINYFIFRAKVAREDAKRAEVRSDSKRYLIAIETANKNEQAAIDLARDFRLLSHKDLHFKD